MSCLACKGPLPENTPHEHSACPCEQCDSGGHACPACWRKHDALYRLLYKLYKPRGVVPCIGVVARHANYLENIHVELFKLELLSWNIVFGASPSRQ